MNMEQAYDEPHSDMPIVENDDIPHTPRTNDESMFSSPRYFATVRRATEMPRSLSMSEIFWSESAFGPSWAPMISRIISLTAFFDRSSVLPSVVETALLNRFLIGKMPQSVSIHFAWEMREIVV